MQWLRRGKNFPAAIFIMVLQRETRLVIWHPQIQTAAEVYSAVISPYTAGRPNYNVVMVASKAGHNGGVFFLTHDFSFSIYIVYFVDYPP